MHSLLRLKNTLIMCYKYGLHRKFYPKNTRLVFSRSHHCDGFVKIQHFSALLVRIWWRIYFGSVSVQCGRVSLLKYKAVTNKMTFSRIACRSLLGHKLRLTQMRYLSSLLDYHWIVSRDCGHFPCPGGNLECGVAWSEWNNLGIIICICI